MATAGLPCGGTGSTGGAQRGSVEPGSSFIDGRSFLVDEISG
jgi:hypothetical protein